MPSSPILNLLFILQLSILPSFINPLMILSQDQEQVNDLKSELPCVDSSNQCIEESTKQAIAFSQKLKTLNSRIALIDERLELMGDRKDYADLEIKAATLEAARAELENKLESEKLALKEKVIELVIEIEVG